MHRVAVFVDAGYLFAQGSVALTGSKKARTDLVLDAPAVIGELKTLAAAVAPTSSLLRIYWYDGAIGGTRMTGDQSLLANLDDVKVRLGFVNSMGQQKGVDSLIVTDLIELARQKALFDAVLLSGDEDVRVGVQIAQNYGVRIHLLGIFPSRGSQSNQLLQEADTTHEWQKNTIARFLSQRAPILPAAATPTPATAPKQKVQLTTLKPQAKHQAGSSDATTLTACAEAFAAALVDTEIEGLQAYWKTDRGLPPELDKRLLPQGRTALGRDLTPPEKRLARTLVQKAVKERITAGKS